MEAILMLRGAICLSLIAIPFITFSQKVIDYPPKIVVICMDGDTRKPMGGVKVVFRKGDTLVKTITTDGTGRCVILKPKPGNYYIAATKNSYMEFTLAHVNVPAEQTVILEIPLDADPNSKQPIKKGKLVASTDNPAIGIEF